MDILQICPPKNLIFTMPNDLNRTLTITNLTLRSLYIYILKSHQYEITLSRDKVLMSAFQELKIEITINYNQEMLNSTLAKIRIYYYQTDLAEEQENTEEKIFSPDNKIQFQQINILFNIDFQSINSLYYQQIIENEERKYKCKSMDPSSKSYLMKRVYPPKNNINSSQLELVLSGVNVKNQIFNYLQHLDQVISIEESQNNRSFLIDFKQNQEDICNFITFIVNQTTIVYSIGRIVAYGKGYSMPTLVNIELDDESPTNLRKTEVQVSSDLTYNKNISIKESKKQQLNPILEVNNSQLRNQQQQSRGVNNKKKQLVKQSFAVNRQSNKIRSKRRNKSQEKIQQASSQSQDADLQIRKQLSNFIQVQSTERKNPKPIKIRHEIKINQTNIEMNEKVLSIYIENKQNYHFIYVVVRDCVRVFILEDLSFKRVIKFDPIDVEHVNMPCPIDIYKDQLIFGNQSYLFWVNLQTGYNEWKYVQRKYIYALAVIQELSLVALGGKNFSKLSYFGKETSRSNIKLYSCSSSDKHDHLFTYDFPGNNVGHVTNMAYISAPPLGTKLLLIHTVNNQLKSSFYFLRVKAFNKVQVYGEIQLDELGILNLLKFKYNKESNRIVCMETLGDTQMDTFKKLKVKCQYQKVQVATQGFKFPLKRFISYHLGGSKDGINKQWMSFVEQNGTVFHLYDFQQNRLDTLQLGKGEIKQIFPLYNGKYLIICSQTVVKIRQKIEIQIKQ